MIQFGDPRLPERFWAKVSPCPMSGCWLWTASQHRLGYGRFQSNGAFGFAHRAAFIALVGVVPDGLELDHRCKVRCCVNPSHLDPVTHAVNMQRGAHAQKTHCPSGHAYTAANTFIRPDPKGDKQRVCRRCRIEQGRTYRAQRGAVPRKGRAA